MKRFWLVLLSLGLIVAFSTSAMAVDVKFSGSYYAAGMYQDRITFNKTDALAAVSTAFYYQRLRLQTEFVVSPGLKLVTRFDAMERAWGAARATANIGTGGSDPASQGTTVENENIAFDLAYISYTSPIGIFNVGYQDDGAWGTVFGDSTAPLGKVQWYGQFGPVITTAYLGKFVEGSYTAKNTAGLTDRDCDMYVLAAIYNFKGGSAGLLGKYVRQAATRGSGFTQNIYALLPYAKAKIGPVQIQAELVYAFGDYVKWEVPDAAHINSTLDNWAGWIDATADFGMVYVGASVAYVAGDDKGTADKKEGGVLTGGIDWNPALILFNFDRYYWAGSITGYNATQMNNANDNPYLATNNGGMTNAWFAQGRVGVRPVAALDIMGAVSVAYADKKPIIVINNDYGWEVDVTATYKITNNLSYMLGVGYLFTGAYYKGSLNSNTIQDDFLVINKLTLTF